MTHQLQYVKYANHIVVMDQGSIVEQGKYDELMRKENGMLRKLVEEFSCVHEKADESDQIEQISEVPAEKPVDAKKQGQLMQEEERATGSVMLKVIWTYGWQMGGPIVVICLVTLFVLAQCGIIASDWFVDCVGNPCLLGGLPSGAIIHLVQN